LALPFFLSVPIFLSLTSAHIWSKLLQRNVWRQTMTEG
jgi:hypothetical protein